MGNTDTKNKISRHGIHRDGYFKDYFSKNPDDIRNNHRKFREGWRDKVINLLGINCKTCGFSDIRALQIDHVNGHGGNARRKWGESYYKKIHQEIIEGSADYQLLCANCNFIKRYTNNELGGVSKKI